MKKRSRGFGSAPAVHAGRMRGHVAEVKRQSHLATGRAETGNCQQALASLIEAVRSDGAAVAEAHGAEGWTPVHETMRKTAEVVRDARRAFVKHCVR